MYFRENVLGLFRGMGGTFRVGPCPQKIAADRDMAYKRPQRMDSVMRKSHASPVVEQVRGFR